MSDPLFDLADKLFDGIDPLPFVETPFVPTDDVLAKRWADVISQLPPHSWAPRLLTLQPTALVKRDLAPGPGSKEVDVLVLNLCGEPGDEVQALLKNDGIFWGLLRDEFGPTIHIELQAF